MNKNMQLQITEAQLEEFFVQGCYERLGLGVLARQMRLDCGILDVFAHDYGGRYYVVELKAEPLKARHLAQVLSYTCELRAKHPHKIIKPMLIGPDVADDYLKDCLVYFGSDLDASGACEYRLYGFDALSGLNLSWVAKNQREAETRRHTWIEEAQLRLNRSGRITASDSSEAAIYKLGYN